MACDDNSENQDGLSVLVKNDVGALVASTVRDLDRRRDRLVGDVADLAFTALVALLLQLLLPNGFAFSFLFSAYDSFVLCFWTDKSDCALTAMSKRLACGLEAHYFLRL